MMKQLLRMTMVVMLCLCALEAQTMKTVPAQYGTIAAAIAAASAGDTISIAAGTYSEQLRIQKNLTLIGAGRELTVIHDAAGAPDSTALFIDNATVSLRDMQFLGGISNDGGRRGIVAVNSNTTIRSCAFVCCFNVAICDVNGTLDIDTVVITTVYSTNPVIADSAGAGQSVSGGYDLGVMLVNTQFTIRHLTGGANIDHVIDIYSDMHGVTMLGGVEYPVDTTRCTQGTIEYSSIFGSRQGYYGQGIRIGGSINRNAPNLVIRYNRIRGTVADSSQAMPDFPTTAGISFNGYKGYAEIYNNVITQFNTGIAFHGIATAMMHDNTITGNARYGVASTDGVYAVTPPDLGGGAYASPGRNTITNNGHFNYYNRNTAVHWACNNYWGTTDASAIDASVYDDNEGASGLVHTENYLAASGVLPVELTSFTASNAGARGIVLAWNTATENNNAGYYVERRSAGALRRAEEWLACGFVQGAGTSAAPHAYTYIDAGLAPGRYAYRLKQVDRDGKYEYSQTVEAGVAAVPAEFALSQNFPNPFNPSTSMAFTVPSDGHARLCVYNALGQRVAVLFDGAANAGAVHTARFDASGLPSGVYLARLEFGTRQTMQKLVLMK